MSGVLNLHLGYSHPDIETQNTDGTCTVGDVLYHVVRCSLLHGAKLPPTLHFIDEKIYSIQEGHLSLPATFVIGLISAVVVSPANAEERTPEHYGIIVEGKPTPLNELWGNKDRLLQLIDVRPAT